MRAASKVWPPCALRTLTALLLAWSLLGTPAPGFASPSSEVTATQLAVLPIIIPGKHGNASLSEVYDAVRLSLRLRPGLRLIGAEELFVRSSEGTGERVRDCGSDISCIAERLRVLHARLGLVVVLNLQLDPALLSLQLIDTVSASELAKTIGEFASEKSSGAPLFERLTAEVSTLLDRAGYREGGRLWVEVEPPAAEVHILGQAPASGTRVFVLPAGRYALEARLEGYESARAFKEVTPGSEARVQLRLEASRSLLASPWLWTLLGAVVVGSAVSASLLAGDRGDCYCVSLGGEDNCTLCR